MPVRPRRNPDIVWRLEKGMREVAWEKANKGEEYEDLGVLTLVVGEAIHQLNLVGAEIWTRINSINTVGKIAAEIAPLFHADPGEMQTDVMEFLKDIEKKGWVTLSSGSDHAAPGWSAR
jgi:GeoRSP system PqqD family protein